MSHPTPHSTIGLRVILPVHGEMLVYMGREALEENAAGCIGYDAKNDIITYHYKLKDLDRQLFDYMKEVDEMWIEVRGGTES